MKLFAKILLIGISYYPNLSFAQVKLQTGTIEYGMPLFSYKDPKSNLSTSVNLVYRGANGIKTSQVASSVGLGFELDFGGSITRIVKGLPDDQYDPNENDYNPYSAYTNFLNPTPSEPVYINPIEHDVFFNGYLYTTYNPEASLPGKISYSPMFPNPNNNPYLITPAYKPAPEVMADREQDVFLLNFGERPIEFIIGKSWDVKILNGARLKIQIEAADMSSLQIRTRISKFIVTDENGMRYHFAAKELTEVTVFSEHNTTTNDGFLTCNPQPGLDISCRYSKAWGIGKHVVNRWMLTKIETQGQNDAIIFNYNTKNQDYVPEIDYMLSKTGNKSVLQYTENRVLVKAMQPAEIVLPDGGKVEFVYSNHNRVDFNDDKPIEKINVYNQQNTLVEGYRFEYDYFFKNAIVPISFPFALSDKKFARLSLKNIRKTGRNGAEMPPTSFNYYCGTIDGLSYYIPSRLTIGCDYWGYNNHLTAQDELTDCYSAYNLVYNFNAPRLSNHGCIAGLLKRITNPQGGYIEYKYEPNKNDGLQYAPGARVSQVVMNDGMTGTSNMLTQYQYKLVTGFTSAWGHESLNNLQTTTTRVWKSNQQVTAGKLGMQIGSGLSKSFLLKGNLPFWRYDLKKSTFSQDLAAGLQPLLAGFLIQTLIYALTPEYQDVQNEIRYKYAFQVMNPLPFQFSRVEVKKQGTTDIGKSVIEFTSPADYPLLLPSISFPYALKSRFVGAFYGAIKNEEVYASTGIREKTESILAFTKTDILDAGHLSKKFGVAIMNYRNNTNATNFYNTLPESNLTVDAYRPYIAKLYITQKKKTVYNDDGTSFETITQYQYNTSNDQLRKVSLVNSKGETVEKYSYYPEDYFIPGHFTIDMISQNMINMPINNESWLIKPGQPKVLADANQVEAERLTNGELRIKKKLNLETSSPLPESAVGAFSSTVYNRMPNNLVEQFRQQHDNQTGLLKQSESKGNKNAMIYDYKNRHLVAIITNSDINDAAYSSFEADGSGGWNFNTTAISAEYYLTGSKAYQLADNTSGISYPVTKSGLDISKKYVITLWKKQDAQKDDLSVTDMSGTSIFTGQKIYSVNDWSLYRYEITGTSNLRLIGTCMIDELRLHPIDAQMVTMTYEPGVGKTSECDANNNVTYLEYDNLNRLRIIRDGKGNVLKTFEYNYKQ
jgi:hypothetical protein